MNQTEFSELMLPMKDKIFRFARSIVIEESEAEDITQDIFEKMWNRRESLKECRNTEAFVMSSVRNLCYDRVRHRQMRDGKYDSLKSEMPTSSAEFPSDYIDTNEIVAGVMKTLPEKQRMVIHLRDIEGREIDDISEIMDIEPPTIRVMLSRARKTLREEMLKIMNYGI